MESAIYVISLDTRGMTALAILDGGALAIGPTAALIAGSSAYTVSDVGTSSRTVASGRLPRLPRLPHLLLLRLLPPLLHLQPALPPSHPVPAAWH